MGYGNLSSIRNIRLNLSSGSGLDANISAYMLQAYRYVEERIHNLSIDADTLMNVEEDYTCFLLRSQLVESWSGDASPGATVYKERALNLLDAAIKAAEAERGRERLGMYSVRRF